MILCDIGNTTYHFLDGKKDFKVATNQKLPKLKSTIYFISVNKKATKKLLKSYPDAIDIQKYIKFSTKYKGMGIDRKVACSYISNGIVVDAGSAITVDVMKNSKHKGGFILPGLNSYKSIYPNISDKLKFELDTNIKLNKLPLNTNQAINYAILKPIISQIKSLQKKDTPIHFTGGDGKLLEKYFKNTIFEKNLLFESMKKIIYNYI